MVTMLYFLKIEMWRNNKLSITCFNNFSRETQYYHKLLCHYKWLRTLINISLPMSKVNNFHAMSGFKIYNIDEISPVRDSQSRNRVDSRLRKTKAGCNVRQKVRSSCFFPKNFTLQGYVKQWKKWQKDPGISHKKLVKLKSNNTQPSSASGPNLSSTTVRSPLAIPFFSPS